MTIGTTTKDPNDKALITVDWAAVIGDGEYITAADFTGATVTISDKSFSATTSFCFIAGGTNQTDYTITATMTTNKGLQLQRTFVLQVRTQ